MSDSQKAIDVRVLVVGAGPTGLMAASEMARRSIACRVIDKLPQPSKLSKALALHARTLEIFESIGIVDRFVTAGVKAPGGSLYADGKRITHFLFDGLDSRYDYALMLPQDETERLLDNHLESLGLKDERPVELVSLVQDADCVTATLRTADGREEQCRAEYVIGCDGAHSTVRHVLNVPFEGKEYEENFALADITADSSMPDDEICGFASEKGVIFFFPITHGRYRMIADVDEVRAGDPSVEDLQKIVDEQCHFPIRLHDPKWTAYFKIHRRQAVSYRIGRVFLAGDAAHIHSPFGGQGMNTGLQDAYNLAWKLALTLKGAAKPALLDSYAPERNEVGRQVLRMTDTMTQVMELRNPVAAAIRNRIISALSSSEIFESVARREMSQLAVNYRQSPIVGEYNEGLYGAIAAVIGGPRAGDRAPDAARLRSRDGKPLRLFDLLRGDTHKLLLISGAQPSADDMARLVSAGKQVSAKFAANVTAYLVTQGNTPAPVGWDGETIFDNGELLHRAFHAAGACAYIIRPDGYIGYRSFPPDAPRLIEHLSQILA